MKITIVVGSIRKGRQSHKIALYLHRLLLELPGVSCEYLDLADTPLPLLDEKWENQIPVNPSLAKVGELLKTSDSLLFISPEYHGSYTGVLKNAIDHYWKEFSKKVIGVVVTGSGKFGGINASSQLQQLILSLGAFPLPQKLIIPFVQHAFDENGNPTEDALKADCQTFIKEFIWFSQAIFAAKAKSVKSNKA